MEKRPIPADLNAEWALSKRQYGGSRFAGQLLQGDPGRFEPDYLHLSGTSRRANDGRLLEHHPGIAPLKR